MTKEQPMVYPYIPNSVPEVKAQMLAAIKAKNVEDFFQDVPEELRFKGKLNLPEPFLSEYALKRHVEGILSKNKTTQQYLNFLGGGCYQHHVPSICDEVNRRGQFLTAYAGEPYDDLGRFQTLFEYASMMGERRNMDVVNVPTYDGYQAAATAIRMAARLTGRSQALVANTIGADKLSKIKDFCQPDIEIKLIECSDKTGQLDMARLTAQISKETAAVYFDNPNYLGVIETQGEAIAQLTHKHGSVCVVGADPISLGILTPPADYGADIVCGDIQPLGMHIQFGGGQAGYIATHDKEEYVMEFPSRLFGLAPTSVPGEYGFGDVAYDRTSFAVREEGKEWVGTAAALWGITAGVYLALMGPQGMADLGKGILLRTRYAMQELDRIPGVKAPAFQSPHFREFAVNFDDTGKTVAEINQALLDREIFGGKELVAEYPELGQSALYCITEVHTKDDIDRLVAALKEVLAS